MFCVKSINSIKTVFIGYLFWLFFKKIYTIRLIIIKANTIADIIGKNDIKKPNDVPTNTEKIEINNVFK